MEPLSPADRLAAIAALMLVAAGLAYLVVQMLSRRFAGRHNDPEVPRDLDRRRHLRRPVERVTARLSSAPNQQGVRVENISPGGMCLSADALSLPTHTVLKATLTAPGLDRPIEAEARAVWVEQGRAGLAFTRVDAELRGWLEHL